MNLTKMFKIQKELDERIVKEKDLKGVDLLDKKILSLQVELGELANELPEVFKFWSNKKNNYKKALEEYCDCLHFILSIGNDVMAPKVFCEGDLVAEFEETTELQFLKFNKYLHSKFNRVSWINVMNLLLGLGEMLGFTWEQIEQAYYDKNKVNHERQSNGY